MTAVSTLYGPAAIGNLVAYSSALSALALSDADNSVAWLLPIRDAGTITHVGFLLVTINGSPPNYNAAIVTLDSSGNPTTTAYGGSAVTTFTPSGTGWTWVALSTGATANAGDFAAVRVWPTGTVPDGSNHITVCRAPFAGYGITTNYATSWAPLAGASAGPMAIKYDGGAVFGNAITSTTVHAQLRSDSTPDEAGCKFQLPAAMTVRGAQIGIDTTYGTSATFDVVLYNGAGTALATTSVSDKDFTDNSAYVNVWFTPVSLAAATDYRLVVKPGVAGSGGNVNIQRYQFEDAAAVAAWPPGDGLWQYTYRTDAGAWTDVATDLSYMGLWVSDITFSTTGGGGGEYAYIG
jgi:hypothetical protein